MTTPDLWIPPGAARESGIETADKALALDALGRSVQATPETDSPLGSMLLWIAQRADGFTAWGSNPKIRDRELRAFLPTENMLISAHSIVCARNAALEWKVTGDEQTAEAAQQMLNNANYGMGWESFIIQLSHDLYAADNGAYVELIREAPREDAPVIGISTLDSVRCYQTGNPQFPIIYEDINGKMHRMPWFSIVQLMEMPSPITPAWGGPFYRLQYCAITRVLRAAQVLRSISIYKDEKVSGRFLRALHLISGVSEQSVQDAIARAHANADSAGLTAYIQPAMVGGVDPNTAIKHDTIELSSLPEGWDEEKSIRVYILALSMGYLTDYQEFAPLEGGNLGTSQQSEILHMKSKGKGPGLFQKLIGRLMNLHGVLPSNVLFEFDEPDIEAQKAEDEARKTRSETRALRITSGEIDVEAARQIAFEDGDLPSQVYDDIVEREAERAVDEEERARQDAERTREEEVIEGEGIDPEGNTVVAVEGEDGESQGMRSVSAMDAGYDPEEFGLFGTRETAATAEENNPKRTDLPSPLDRDRLDYEAEVGAEIAKGLAQARTIVRKRMTAGA